MQTESGDGGDAKRIKVTLTLPRGLVGRVDSESLRSSQTRSKIVEDALGEWMSAPGHFTSVASNDFFLRYIRSSDSSETMYASAVHGGNILSLFESLGYHREKVTELHVNCLPKPVADELCRLGILSGEYWQRLMINLGEIDKRVKKLIIIQPEAPFWIHGVCWKKVAICGQWDFTQGNLHPDFGIEIPMFSLDPRSSWKLDETNPLEERAFKAYVALFRKGRRSSLKDLNRNP